MHFFYSGFLFIHCFFFFFFNSASYKHLKEKMPDLDIPATSDIDKVIAPSFMHLPLPSTEDSEHSIRYNLKVTK